jgi:hypothetical protein
VNDEQLTVPATTLFELDRRDPGDGKPAVIYVRDMRRRPIKKAQHSVSSQRPDPKNVQGLAR